VQLFSEDKLAAEHEALQHALKRAAGYFVPQLQQVLQLLPHSPAVTDSRTRSIEYNDALNDCMLPSLKKYYTPSIFVKMALTLMSLTRKKTGLP